MPAIDLALLGICFSLLFYKHRSGEMLTDNLPRPEKLKSATKMKTFIIRAPDHPRSSYAHHRNRRSMEMLTDNLPMPEKLEK